ncbi:sugar ABC transporter solute-binding protein [Streptantibioticus cattleyicolor NRRL 8057 = DSM 46488]|uniref:Sugar ABC transporter solute-binding protein n=1 Tax=Streptantibioticus cattleyicolor (strain ATCC 35852 / DSM 46488 / JCM 4925 / NBRC 14057 / NRRL 8057) TaxID=1003195 RepID=G8WWF3_STREN|nr:sugar ABC transporter solute-binding protein [Streptantibioticus cattleyicolor NRRL 8057 = DSM 46488]
MRSVVTAAVVAALAVGAAGCGSGGGKGGGSGSSPGTGGGRPSVSLPDLHGQHLELAAVWTGPEQKNMEKVLKEFEKRTGATVTYTPTGDSASTFLGTKIAGGKPPDVALLSQVGVLHQFAQKGWIKPADAEVQRQLDANYSKGWQDLGAYQGKRYGVPFKAANKSLVWYNSAAFQNAGVAVPKTWADFLKTAQAISDSGTPPVSVGGADGWPLTDWFENVYLSQAGGEKYDQLTQHKIKWTDPSVKAALTTLAQLFGKDQLLAGGRNGALQTDFPKAVTQTFTGNPPGAAMVYAGDFAASFILANTKAKVGAEAKIFPFPAVGGGRPPVVTGADTAVALTGGKGAQALLAFLASPDAARIWAQAGGFISPDKSLDPSVYPDEVTRSIAKQLIDAGDTFRMDMSDQAPAAFGGTKGEGEWKDLQDFLAHPDDIAGAQAKLEQDAAKAYGNG